MTTALTPSSRGITDIPPGGIGRPARPSSRRGLVAWLFVLPLVVVNGGVVLVPGLFNIYYSFTSWDGLSSPKWIGLQNYVRLVTDPVVQGAFLRNVVWAAIFLTVPMSMGLFSAFLLQSVRKLGGIYRTIFFLPYIVATVVVASIWGLIYSPASGLPALLHNFGLPTINFLGNPQLALWSVALANIWQWWGFLSIVFYAAMVGVDRSLYEAAELDGAGQWYKFWAVTFPSIRPTFMFMCLMSLIWSFLIFDYVYILTGGGPAGSTEVLGTLLYRTAFQAREAGYAAAIGILMGVISLVVVLGYQAIGRRKRWEI